MSEWLCEIIMQCLITLEINKKCWDGLKRILLLIQEEIEILSFSE
jgi:hypothetical protein